MGLELPPSHTASGWESWDESLDSPARDLCSGSGMHSRVWEDGVTVKRAYTSQHSQMVAHTYSPSTEEMRLTSWVV